MQWIIIIGIFLIMSIISMIVKDRRTKAALIQKIKTEWGDVSKVQYSTEKMQSIQFYFNLQKEGKTIVDDITWNDMHMDQIFLYMNQTQTSPGEEYLYYLLRNLEQEEEILKERDQLITLFQEKNELREKIQILFGKMGKLKTISMYEYFSRIDAIEMRNSWIHILLAFGLLGSIFFAFIPKFANISFFFIMGFVVVNLFTYFSEKAKIENYFTLFKYIVRFLQYSNELCRMGAKEKELEPYLKKLEKEYHVLKRFQRGSSIALETTESGGEIIMNYIRILFHVDLIKFQSMLYTIRQNKNSLNTIFEIIGLIDSMIAVASFRTCFEEYSKPILLKGESTLEIYNAYHPLIEHPVKNSITVENGVLITGSNASGKSTFLRTVAINAILSQTIYTTFSSFYRAGFFRVYSSMALHDDLIGGASYYMVEIRSLKRIFDQIEKRIPILCFVDEVLRGTNTIERIAASSQILYSLAKDNVVCFAATHDIELTHILEQVYSNYHFQEKIEDGQILFDYQLYKGRAVSKNAIELLRIIGYEKEIIEAAKEQVNYFLDNGIWKKIQEG